VSDKLSVHVTIVPGNVLVECSIEHCHI